MEFGIELAREDSPASYLLECRAELPAVGVERAVLAAIETGIALEDWRLGEARRRWGSVVEAARSEGTAARRRGWSPRRIALRIDRLREAVDTILFDGRLPADLAALASRRAAKMCALAMVHALRSYWQSA